MKKIYTLLLLAVSVLLMPAVGRAATVVLNIDDPSRVEIEVNREPYAGTLMPGDNTITSFYLTIRATEGNILEAVNWIDGSYDIPVSNNEASFGTFTEGARYEVVTKSAAVAQSSVVKLDVDKASAVRASFEETSRMVELSDGLNELKYDPTTEKTLKIYSSVTAQMPLYSVKVEGGSGSVSKVNNVYFVSLPCEGTVKVISQFPDQECKVNFNLSSTAAGFIKKITADSTTGEEVPMVNNAVKVNAGSVLYIHGDVENYAVYSYKVDDYEQDFSSPQRLLVLGEDINVAIDAEKYPEYTITLNVDRPEAVFVQYGSTMYPGSAIETEAGDNTVVMNINKTSILISPADAHNYRILSVKHKGMDIEPNYAGKFQVSDLAESDRVEVKTEAIVRELHAVVYLDNEEANLWSLTDATGAKIALHSGYNHLMVAAEDSPFTLRDGYGMAYVYINDEPVVAVGSFMNKSYNINLGEGSVAKIYVDSDDEPEFHALRFTPEAFESVDVKADEMTLITRHTGYEVLAGTKIEIAPHADMKVQAKLDGEDLEADEKGNYSFSVSGPHSVELTAEPTSGIEDLPVADADAAKGVIYNLQGMRVRMAEGFKLPSGLYIIDGRKVMVK